MSLRSCLQLRERSLKNIRKCEFLDSVNLSTYLSRYVIHVANLFSYICGIHSFIWLGKKVRFSETDSLFSFLGQASLLRQHFIHSPSQFCLDYFYIGYLILTCLLLPRCRQQVLIFSFTTYLVRVSQ